MDRREPEILALIEERGAAPFSHHLASRLGLLPLKRRRRVVRVAPPSLVEHLEPRCRGLDPPQYTVDTLVAAALGEGTDRHPLPHELLVFPGR